MATRVRGAMPSLSPTSKGVDVSEKWDRIRNWPGWLVLGSAGMVAAFVWLWFHLS